MSDPTSYSPCGQAIMKFLADCYICMKFQNYNEYFTPLQVGMSLKYAEASVRRQMRILSDNNYITRHRKCAMYKVTTDVYQKYLEDKNSWIPKPTIPIHPRNQYMKRIPSEPPIINTKPVRKRQ
jgi:hypothetical protein